MPSAFKTKEQLEAAIKEAGGMEELLNALADVMYDPNAGVARHDGTQILLPPDMSPDQAISYLKQYNEDQEKPTESNYDIPYALNDVLVAMDEAIKRMFGFAITQAKFGFFSYTPPQMATITIGMKGRSPEQVQVPSGRIALPGIWDEITGVGWIEATGKRKRNAPITRIQAYTKKKHQSLIKMLVDMARQIVEENSIYRGKVINMGLEHIDISHGFDPDMVVWSKEVARQISANIITPMRFPEQCERIGLERRRAVLLSGDYGTGKTWSMKKIGIIASSEYGWTVIIGRAGEDLKDMIYYARMYQPALLLIEDVDSQTGGDRDIALNEILEAFDGILSGRDRVMAVMTTNNVDTIHPAFLRPGRTSKIIRLGALDGEGLEQMARTLGIEYEEGIDWQYLAEIASDLSPAYDKEAFSMIGLYKLDDGHLDEPATQQDIEDAFVGMHAHKAQQDRSKDGNGEHEPTLKEFHKDAAIAALEEWSSDLRKEIDALRKQLQDS